MTKYQKQTWTDYTSGPATPDQVATASRLNHIEDGIANADAAIKSFNGSTGDEDGAITANLNSILGVTIAPVQYDDDGVTPLPGTGPQPGDLLQVDSTGEFVNGPLVGYAPANWVAPYTVRGLFLAAGDVPPADLPDDVVIFDETKPTAPLYALVNTVTASGTTLTIPAAPTATVHNVTLSANCTITFPTAVDGTSFSLLLRQDATGSRTVTWPATGVKWNGGTAPTLSTAAGTEDFLEFFAVGSSWRQRGAIARYAAGATAGATPTVRGVFSANSGASNTQPSASTTLPAGIATGDRGFLVISIDGITKTFTGPPTGWTLVDGPIAAGSQTTWLYSRTMASTDSSATISTGTLSGSATGRPALTGIIVAGGTATGEVVTNNQDITADTTLDVPAITPGVANSLLVHIAAVRVSIQTTAPTAEVITNATGWTPRKEHYEARWDTTNVNFGGYIETKALTGQGNVAQTATTATYLGTVPATERSYVIAVPPPVA